MKDLYFDCYSGISGDMTLGALVDIGVPIDDMRKALKSLPVTGYTVEDGRVTRCGISATRIIVRSSEKQPHRGFSQIKAIIEGSGFNAAVKERAIQAFHKLAVAEAEVHETTIEQVHFHEVGAIDAIVDIVGAMWGFDHLGIQSARSSSVAVGSGTVKAAHGVMPVPAPATAKLLRGVPVNTGPVGGELTTPTGAAILTTICSSFGPLENFSVERVGYGAGTREYSGHTNYLRVMVGTNYSNRNVSVTMSGNSLPVESHRLVILQTEIDDMSAEMFGHVLERLFASGCLDAYTTPIQMKKNRPAVSLQVLTDPENAEAMIEIILRETTTFGVKVVDCNRLSLQRRMEHVETHFGSIRVKVGLWDGKAIKASPEYEDCRVISVEKGVPLAEVFAAANSAIQRLLGRE